MIARLIAATGKLPALHVWNDELSDVEQERMGRVREELTATPLLIAGPADPSLRVTEPYDGEWPGALVVDDADLGSGASPQRFGSFAARGVLVILTLPRDQVVNCEGLNPLWTCVADFVVDIRRPDLLDHDSPRPGEADLHVIRNRWGPGRRAAVAFQAHYSRFVDYSSRT